MPKMLDVKIPTITVHVTQAIIDRAAPDHRGRCLGAMAIREKLKDKGIYSIHVTPDTVRFNLLVPVNGTPTPMRLMYVSPGILQQQAHTFDFNADKHGTEYARAHCRPFKFILQGHSGCAMPIIKGNARRGPTRLKGSTRVRAACTHEIVRRCARRYHPELAYISKKKKIA